MKYQVTAVENSLSFMNSNDYTAERGEIFNNTTIFSQAATKSKVGTGFTPDYFQNRVNFYSTVGWIIRDQGSDKMDFGGSNMSAFDAMNQVMSVYLAGDDKNAFTKILNAMDTSNDVGVHGFTTFFWNQAKRSDEKVNFVVGPMTYDANENALGTTIVFYDFNIEASSWRSMFVKHDSAHIGGNAYHARMSLNIDSYNDLVKDALEARLKGKIAGKVSTIPLDLG